MFKNGSAQKWKKMEVLRNGNILNYSCSCGRADDKDRIRLILKGIDEVASRIVTYVL